MTTPTERIIAIRNAKAFLMQLLDPSQTKGVPRAIRQEARHRLRHYPTDYDIQVMFEELNNGGFGEK